MCYVKCDIHEAKNEKAIVQYYGDHVKWFGITGDLFIEWKWKHIYKSIRCCCDELEAKRLTIRAMDCP